MGLSVVFLKGDFDVKLVYKNETIGIKFQIYLNQ